MGWEMVKGAERPILKTELNGQRVHVGALFFLNSIYKWEEQNDNAKGIQTQTEKRELTDNSIRKRNKFVMVWIASTRNEEEKKKTSVLKMKDNLVLMKLFLGFTKDSSRFRATLQMLPSNRSGDSCQFGQPTVKTTTKWMKLAPNIFINNEVNDYSPLLAFYAPVPLASAFHVPCRHLLKLHPLEELKKQGLVLIVL